MIVLPALLGVSELLGDQFSSIGIQAQRAVAQGQLQAQTGLFLFMLNVH